MAIFKRRDLEQYTDSLSDYLPGGRLFGSRAVNGSNFRKLLRGMAGELFRSNGLLKEYSEQIIPDQTVKFIEEWESTLGIPDSCFTGAGTIDVRRRDVLAKLAASGVQTVQDFIDLAAFFGISVTIVPIPSALTFPFTFPLVLSGPSGQTFPFTFPLVLSGLSKRRFTIFIEFTVEDASRFTFIFPFIFGGENIAILECLFNKLRPANCSVVFTQV